MIEQLLKLWLLDGGLIPANPTTVEIWHLENALKLEQNKCADLEEVASDISLGSQDVWGCIISTTATTENSKIILEEG
jgi:hypothetical protein